MTHAEKKVRDLQIVELRKQGYSMNQLAEKFELSDGTISNICKRYGVAGVMSDRRPQTYRNQNKKITEEEKRAYVESFLPIGFSYVSGYIDSDHKITIRCKVCKSVFERSMVSIRHHNSIICECCKAEKQMHEQKRKERERIERQNQARERLIQKEAERQAKTRTVECEVCSNTFTTRNPLQVCCSAECSRKRFNRISSHRKDSRITDDKRIDKDITAMKLFKRDYGVCWICGGICDTDDYITRDGTFIAGNNYPSVDHIVAIADGGEDSWENVRLAHRICNTRRYWNQFAPSPKIFVTP